MGLLSSLYQQQQQINQNPTTTVKTPIQIAYDNYLNAQANAQNTKQDELGSAIGNSVNGLAKIIASSVIKNPFEKAGATSNLDNFDARQDDLVRNWALQRAKKRNDFVNQAREQLGMAKADEEQAYNRDLTTQQLAYKKLQDEIANKLNEDKLKFAKEQAEQAQKNFDKEYNLKLDALNNKPVELTEEEKLQNEIKKLEAIENAKAKIQANQDLSKTSAEYNAFKSQLGELNELSKQSGNSFSRAFGAVTNPLTGGKTNLAANELKSKVLQALYTAKGYDTDKINPQTSKDLLKQVGMPSSGYPTQAQMKIIIDNIDNIYKQRIASQQNFANSFNSVSWE